MMTFFASRTVRRVLAPLLLCASGVLPAVTYTVGPDAGQPGSACDFATPAEAIAALPPDDDLHTLRVETLITSDPDFAIGVYGRRVRVVGDLEAGSGCTVSDTSRTLTLELATSSLGGGRSVEVALGGYLELINVSIEDNPNGGILVDRAELAMIDSFVVDNSTSEAVSGGGILVNTGTLRLDRTFVFRNTASGAGGGLFCFSSGDGRSQIRIENGSRFNSNSATSGGGIYLFNGCDLHTGRAALFQGNRASRDGGAIGSEDWSIEPQQGSSVNLHSTTVFGNNEADRHGGALQITGGNRLAVDDIELEFVANHSGRDGGALYLAGEGEDVHLGDAIVVANRAGGHGGAIAVRSRTLHMTATCRSVALDDTPLVSPDRYCAHFSANGFHADFGQNRSFRLGASIFVDDGQLFMDRYAVIGNDASTFPNSDYQGLALSAIDSRVRLRNILVADHLDDIGQTLLDINGDSSLLLFNTTVAGNDGLAVEVDPEAAGHFIGTVVAGNDFGVVGDGVIIETCSLLQRGSSPPPVNPGFVVDDRGHYRPGADSPLRSGGLTCDPDVITESFVPPLRDLDGARRTLADQDPMDFDIGAFEFHNEDLEFVFIDGFD